MFNMWTFYGETGVHLKRSKTCCFPLFGESERKMANLTRNCSNVEKEIEEMDASTVPETIPSFPQSSCTDKSGMESELIKVVPSPVDLTLTPPKQTLQRGLVRDGA